LLRPENPVERSRHPNSPFDKLRANWWVIFEGTYEIQRLVISRAISGIHIK
jgi:hypothetical protein